MNDATTTPAKKMISIKTAQLVPVSHQWIFGLECGCTVERKSAGKQVFRAKALYKEPYAVRQPDAVTGYRVRHACPGH